MKIYQKILIGLAAGVLCCLALIPLAQRSIEYATRHKYVLRHETLNSVYYWRTTFNLSDAERAFLEEHNIKRVYLHLFDIDESGYHNAEPVATLLFKDSLPFGIEYVPTVYITQDAIRSINGKESEFAQKIVTRVLNMVDWHYIPNVQEMQIDGDWQSSYRDTYFALCKAIRSLLHEKNIALSATIRLSNLRELVPPVDYGVLMLYNTNSVNDADAENSILTIQTCQNYLSNNAVKKYGLHLDYAFPTFAWSAVYDEEGDFRCLVTHTDFDDAQFEQIDQRHYRARWYGDYKRLYYWANDKIRTDYASPELLDELKDNLEISNDQSIILYHLDDSQLTRYSHEDIENIFAR
ncbi:MAG: hypothetical protein MJZ82_03945 [Paludibacteraceae bacterium]|nr:hypothetical protein [Paludibacteraceae bacterium]